MKNASLQFIGFPLHMLQIANVCLIKETSVTFINYKLRNMNKKFSSYKKRVVYLMLDDTKL